MCSKVPNTVEKDNDSSSASSQLHQNSPRSEGTHAGKGGIEVRGFVGLDYIPGTRQGDGEGFLYSMLTILVCT